MPGAFVARSQSRQYVFPGWAVLLASGDHAPVGKAFFGASTDSQRGLRDGPGTVYRTCREPGLSGMGLPGVALSLSWADLPDLFSSLDSGVFCGHDAAQCGRAVVDTAKIKRDAALPIPVYRAGSLDIVGADALIRPINCHLSGRLRLLMNNE